MPIFLPFFFSHFHSVFCILIFIQKRTQKSFEQLFLMNELASKDKVNNVSIDVKR